MNKIRAFVEVNIKLLCKDKLSFIWSIVFPSIMLLININNLKDNDADLFFWWVYIVTTSFLFGIGVYALQLRESGTLRVVFSFSRSPYVFFMGNLITQLLYCMICLITFDIILVIILKGNFVYYLSGSAVSLLYCLPVAFAGYNLTLIKKVHANTVNTVANIVVFAMFVLLSTDLPLNKINPLYFISRVIISGSLEEKLIYLMIAMILILFSLPSIKFYRCISNERR